VKKINIKALDIFIGSFEKGGHHEESLLLPRSERSERSGNTTNKGHSFGKGVWRVRGSLQ